MAAIELSAELPAAAQPGRAVPTLRGS